MAEVDVMPTRRAPRTPEEAHWMKRVRQLWGYRHTSKISRLSLKFAVRQLRKWRNLSKEPHAEVRPDPASPGHGPVLPQGD